VKIEYVRVIKTLLSQKVDCEKELVDLNATLDFLAKLKSCIGYDFLKETKESAEEKHLQQIENLLRTKLTKEEELRAIELRLQDILRLYS